MKKVSFISKNYSELAFFRHRLGDLGVTYALHLYLVLKRMIDFVPSASSYSWGNMSQSICNKAFYQGVSQLEAKCWKV